MPHIDPMFAVIVAHPDEPGPPRLMEVPDHTTAFLLRARGYTFPKATLRANTFGHVTVEKLY